MRDVAETLAVAGQAAMMERAMLARRGHRPPTPWQFGSIKKSADREALPWISVRISEGLRCR